MVHHIKHETYTTDKLKEQVKLVNSIAKNWTAFGYPDVQALKNSYESNPNFTPETRHYFYDGDTLIGFISSAVESPKDGRQYGSIQYPFLMDQYKSLEKDIMQTTIMELKKRGVEIVTSNFHRSWGDSERIIKEYQYEEKDVWEQFAILDKQTINKLQFRADTSLIKEFDPKTDGEKLYEAIYEPQNLPRERLDRFLNYVETSNTLISFPTLVRDRKLKAFTRIEFEEDVDSLFTFHIQCFDENENQQDIDRQSVLKYVLDKVRDHPSTLYLYLGGDQSRTENYKFIGLTFETIKTYELNLS